MFKLYLVLGVLFFLRFLSLDLKMRKISKVRFNYLPSVLKSNRFNSREAWFADTHLNKFKYYFTSGAADAVGHTMSVQLSSSPPPLISKVIVATFSLHNFAFLQCRHIDMIKLTSFLRYNFNNTFPKRFNFYLIAEVVQQLEVALYHVRQWRPLQKLQDLPNFWKTNTQ